MKILIISQYFWPENFRVNELVEELLKYGHKITILTGYPNYPEGEIYSEFKKNFKLKDYKEINTGRKGKYGLICLERK